MDVFSFAVSCKAKIETDIPFCYGHNIIFISFHRNLFKYDEVSRFTGYRTEVEIVLPQYYYILINDTLTVSLKSRFCWSKITIVRSVNDDQSSTGAIHIWRAEQILRSPSLPYRAGPGHIQKYIGILFHAACLHR